MVYAKPAVWVSKWAQRDGSAHAMQLRAAGASEALQHLKRPRTPASGGPPAHQRQLALFHQLHGATDVIGLVIDAMAKMESSAMGAPEVCITPAERALINNFAGARHHRHGGRNSAPANSWLSTSSKCGALRPPRSEDALNASVLRVERAKPPSANGRHFPFQE